MKPRFAFDPDAAIAHLRANDEIFAGLIDRIGTFSLELNPAGNLFEAMMRAIVYQQLHGNAARAIHARVVAALKSNGGDIPQAILATPDAILRSAGLSARKRAAIRDLALKCEEDVVPTIQEAWKLSDDELVERLTQVRGIGPWSVHMLLIFTLGRPDILPTGDFSVRLAFKKLYRKRMEPTPEVMIKHARRWQPYRSVASWYLWRSLDTD